MRFIIASWLILLGLFLGNQAFACSIAPHYLNGEFGSKGVVLRNVSSDAHKILIGRFRKAKSRNDVFFKPKKNIKPKTFFSTKKDIHLTFLEVQREKIYLYEGQEDQVFDSFFELRKFITLMRPSTDLDSLEYGSGGPIAGVHHGTDCQRFVLAHLDQDYLIYLDSKNKVMASFPIKSNSKDFIQGATTLFAID